MPHVRVGRVLCKQQVRYRKEDRMMSVARSEMIFPRPSMTSNPCRSPPLASAFCLCPALPSLQTFHYPVGRLERLDSLGYRRQLVCATTSTFNVSQRSRGDISSSEGNEGVVGQSSLSLMEQEKLQEHVELSLLFIKGVRTLTQFLFSLRTLRTTFQNVCVRCTDE